MKRTKEAQLTPEGEVAEKTYAKLYEKQHGETPGSLGRHVTFWNRIGAAVKRVVLRDLNKGTMLSMPPDPPKAKRAAKIAALALLALSAHAATICDLQCLATSPSNLAACVPVEDQIGLMSDGATVTLSNLGPYGVSIVELWQGATLWTGKLDIGQSAQIAFSGLLDGAVVTIQGIGGAQFLTRFEADCADCGVPEPASFLLIGAGLVLLATRRGFDRR